MEPLTVATNENVSYQKLRRKEEDQRKCVFLIGALGFTASTSDFLLYIFRKKDGVVRTLGVGVICPTRRKGREREERRRQNEWQKKKKERRRIRRKDGGLNLDYLSMA